MPPARRRRLFAALGYVALLGAAVPATLPAQPAAATDEAIVDKDDGRIPIERAIRFALRGNDLAVSSELTVGDGARQVRLRGLEGNTRVTVSRRPRGPMGLVPYFELNHTGSALPDGSGYSQTTITAQGTAVRIVRQVRLNDVQTTVSLAQDNFSRRGRPVVEPHGERVSLRVRSPQATGRMPAGEELRLSAGSFAELMRKHPGPAAEFLAPLFRDFGQDAAVFRVDPRLAWQLFPDAVEPDAATASKVLALVDRLDADDFRQRELATVELEVLGGPAITVLAEVDRATLTPEQNTRVDAILARYTQLDETEVATLQADPEFLLRCFTYSDLPPVRAAAARVLSHLVASGPRMDAVELDPRPPLPARVQAADAFRQRLPSDE